MARIFAVAVPRGLRGVDELRPRGRRHDRRRAHTLKPEKETGVLARAHTVSPVGDLAHDTDVVGSDGRYTATVSGDWEIWGPMGGYVAAIALRAAAAEAPP